MFRDEKVNVPVLGVVENMAWFTPGPHPDERYYIFGNGGAARLARELEVPLLAQIPLVADVCQRADTGHPGCVARPLAARRPQGRGFRGAGYRRGRGHGAT